jgi:hypothetical protein
MLSTAQRAVRTRKARQDFVKKYGQDSFNVVCILENGGSTLDAELRAVLPRTTVAAIAANLTRGTYNYALANCNTASAKPCQRLAQG